MKKIILSILSRFFFAAFVVLFASCSIVDLNDIKEKAYEHMDPRLNGTWVAPGYYGEKINFSYGNVKVSELDSSGINYILTNIGSYTTNNNSITVTYNQIYGPLVVSALGGSLQNRLYTKAELEAIYGSSVDSLLTFAATYSVTNNVFNLTRSSVTVSYNKM